jgi:hypothetical protein
MIDYIQMYANWRTRRMLRRVNGRALERLAPKIKQAEPRELPPPDKDGVDLHVIRMTARHRLTLAGLDAQTLEHALTAVEVERDLLNKELDYYYRTPTERTTVTTPRGVLAVKDQDTQPKDFAPDRPSMVANKAQRRTVPPGT